MNQSFRTMIAVFIFIAVSLLIGVAVIALLPGDARQVEIDRFIVGLPAIVAGVPGVLAYMRAKDAAQIGTQNAEALNGSLDARIKAGALQAIQEHMATTGDSPVPPPSA